MPGSNSSGSTASKGNIRRKRKVPTTSDEPEAEFELNKDGELVPVMSGQLDLDVFEEDEKEDEIGIDSEDGSAAKGSQSRSKRKQTFERRNIKRVRADVKLSDEAQNAQRAEMERRMRLQMEQQSIPVGGEVPPVFFTPSAFGTSETSPSFKVKEIDVTLKDDANSENQLVKAEPISTTLAGVAPFPETEEDIKPSGGPPASTASEKLFKQQHDTFGIQTGNSEETAIVLLGDSDDEIEAHLDGNCSGDAIIDPVIELSDDEDGAAAAEDATNSASGGGSDVQAEFCELRDADNLPDSEGRICIRKGSTDAESFYLSPHIAQVIKPHQVSGVRFLFDNLIESKSQFQRGSGFGCILAHSMGLGKSIQVIAFLDLIFRYCRPVAKSVLLIVPINTLQNWQTEFQLWLPSVLHPAPPNTSIASSSSSTSLATATTTDSSPKYHENGHLNQHLHPPTPVPSSESATHEVQSSPSLLSLINDSPPPAPLSQTLETEDKGEPLFPPPLTASSAVEEEMERTKEDQEKTRVGSVQAPKIEEPVPPPPRFPLGPPPFRLHVIKDTTKSLDARYQVVHEWDRVGGVLLMGYEMFRLLTNPRRQQNRANPSLHPSASTMAIHTSAFGGTGPMFGGCYPGMPMSASANVLFPTLDGGGGSNSSSSAGYGVSNRRRKRAITIDIEKDEKEEHMLVDMRIALTDPGPQIVICDEGHRIKNSEASISRALKALRTRRRVVLTGYPLQNNLMEYWCMVDFVRPNYLGTKAEFTNMFQRPIENGQCVDSTPVDRKLMQGRAHVLHELLSGFVQRRSHAVLKASLPPKREVVLMVRLSPLQQRLYAALMQYIARASSFVSGGSGLVATPSANTLQTYALCCKIWNHPDILWRVLKENVDDQMDFELDEASNSANGSTSVAMRVKRKQNGSATAQGGIAPATTAATGSGGGSVALVGDDKYAWMSPDLWGPDFRPGDVRNSGKVALFLSLLYESVRAGDKLLLFSQSLLTLDLIERLLGQTSIDAEQPPSPSTLAAAAAEKTTVEANTGQAGDAVEEEEEETEKSLHYRISRRLGANAATQPQVWIRNVHYFRLDGSTSASDRDRLIKRFNDPSNPVRLFLVSTRAGSLGVNLIGANRVVVFDASWNPCHDCQAVCRVYRYGQDKPCYIYRLVSDNTMERKIYDRQVNKQGVSDRVVDEMNPGQQFTRAQVGVLVSYEDKDMQFLTDGDMEAISSLTDEDPALKATLDRHRDCITMKPFTHESLLIDQKDYRLTRVEKRIARQRYEQERLLNNSNSLYRSSAAATAFQYHQYMMMMQQQSGSDPYNQGNMSMSGISGQRGVPNILSKGGSHGGFAGAGGAFLPAVMDDAALRRHEGIQRSRMLQKDLDEARIRALAREIGITLPNGALGSEYTITRVAATADLVFPQSTNPPAPARSISRGEVVEVIHTGVHGKYLRLPRTGDIYVVKPGTGTDSNNRSDEAMGTANAQPPAPLPNSICPRCRQTTVPSNNCICSSSTPTAPSSYHQPTYSNQYSGDVRPPPPQSLPNQSPTAPNYGNVTTPNSGSSGLNQSSLGYQGYN